ncbi:uncharacterized protein HD556DRAFT_1306152 [Suillus plorans]|uniref:DUF6533 domain-containing protein n=1 Tax=Suillus plorans TaxID=116603 RepID=A0A9P7DLW8_9AGAM|nr:uncharacterized protein HD556DRAFT_1306152 [Suillus plorans]KAG1798102.1 hypothetical protein HD556DRAFT_1306152 [Suillus plorans]
MTLVSNEFRLVAVHAFDPITSYIVELIFGREVELVWRQHWSFMTVLYLSVRYAGILHAIISSENFGNRISVSRIMFDALSRMNVAVTVVLGVIAAMVMSRVSSVIYSGFGDLDSPHFMGGPRTMPHSPDCFQTPP